MQDYGGVYSDGKMYGGLRRMEHRSNGGRNKREIAWFGAMGDVERLLGKENY